MTVFDETISRASLRQKLKTALTCCFWIVLLGPPALVLLWAAVAGLPTSWENIAHLYLLVLVHFSCYTPLFGAGLMLTTAGRFRTNRWMLGVGGIALAGLFAPQNLMGHND